MENYNLMGIVIEDRRRVAPDVQEILTEYGEIIKMRLGFNEDDKNNEGFIILNLRDDSEKVNKLIEKLGKINDVRVKNIVI